MAFPPPRAICQGLGQARVDGNRTMEYVFILSSWFGLGCCPSTAFCGGAQTNGNTFQDPKRQNLGTKADLGPLARNRDASLYGGLERTKRHQRRRVMTSCSSFKSISVAVCLGLGLCGVHAWVFEGITLIAKRTQIRVLFLCNQLHFNCNCRSSMLYQPSERSFWKQLPINLCQSIASSLLPVRQFRPMQWVVYQFEISGS